MARLDRIVGDVLDFARPLRLEPAPVDVGDARAGRGRGPPSRAADGAAARFALEPAAGTIVTDGERLRGVLVNLLENAREACVAAGRARRRTRSRSAPGGSSRGRRRCSGSRTGGPGSPPADLPHVFEPYFTTKRTGTGLGLAIARKIVEALGGTIRIESREGEGTRVEIELPAEAPADPRRPMSHRRGSILLVDDEEGILKTLGRALRDEGHEVDRHPSAAEAQRLLAERPFDVLVVDNRMPERTGLELIRDLAAAVPEGERPQVLMMTAHATVENAIEAMKLGAFDYLQKPFEVDELLVVVRRAPRAPEPAPPAPLPPHRARGGVRPLRHRGPQPRRSQELLRQDRARGAVEEHGARSPGRPAPARSWWRGPSTPAAPSARCRSSR